MNPTKIQKEIIDLKKRIESLEEAAHIIMAVGSKNSSADGVKATKDLANFEALMTVVQELAEHEGISNDAFQKHYDALYQFCLARRLETIENTSPSLAAEYDSRTLDDIEKIDSVEPLFPPPDAET